MNVISITHNIIYLLCPLLLLDVPRHQIVMGIWESWTPLKVIVFSWQTLLRWLLTTGNLAKRGVIPLGGQEDLPFCNHTLESEDHLFFLFFTLPVCLEYLVGSVYMI
jgi:hypothetical protein